MTDSKTNEVVEALKWYGEQARLARLIHSEGDAGRHALAADGGKRATAALTASEPLLAQATKIVVGTEYAPCPTCRQYSHSIGEDQLADAFMHFQSMYSHRGDGIPTQHSFVERTRDAAQVLMIAAQGVAQARAQAVEDAAKVADPPLMHRKGKPGLWRRRRAAIAAAIRALAQSEGEGKA
jgi:hypothetical protein